MRTRTASKWFGGIAATLVLTMAASVAPASAAKTSDKDIDTSSSERIAQKRDTGWG
jgi:hypothetical protein